MHPIWQDRRPATPSDDAEIQDDVDDLVVGAGITGLCTALLLARAGRRVQVLEATRVGGLTTGATTGKVSLLQGTKLSRMLQVQSTAVARDYLEANRVGMGWLLSFCEDHGVPFEIRDAITYAATEDEVRTVIAEHAAAGSLGLPVRWADRLDVPFAVHGATVLPDQAQLDPLQVLDALAAEVRSYGGTLVEGARVQSVSSLGRPVVRTDTGSRVRCENVVLATGAPILDRGLYFAKLEARRSYLIALEADAVPSAMLLSAGDPVHSVRDLTGPGANVLVGGYGHVVGRTGSEAGRLDELRSWAQLVFPGAVETHAWSAQDYTSHDGIPYVGRLPRGLGRIYLAAGYDKWGLTNAPAAALRIAGEILGAEPSWGRPMSRRITRPRAAWNLVARNARVAVAGAAGVIAAGVRTVDRDPAPGTGNVGRPGLSPLPVAVSANGATRCAVSGVCTHLGGVLHWNDAEESWDCPLHGSRFAPDGRVIEGPATRALGQV